MRKIYIIIVILLPRLIYAETQVPTEIDNQLWISQNSPYIIESDLIIKGDLIISPGVVVQMGNADIESFKVSGSIKVEGTKENPVIFESYGNEKKNWALVIDSLNTSYIKNAIFRNSFSGVAIKGGEVIFEDTTFSDLSFCLSIENAVVTLDRTIVSDCEDGAIYSYKSKITIEDSDIIGNKENQGILLQSNSELNVSSTSLSSFSNAILTDESMLKVERVYLIENETGLSSKFSNVDIRESVFRGNDVAISLFSPVFIPMGGVGNALSPEDKMIIRDSEFIDSKTYDISNLSKITVDAIQNWWGTNGGPKKNEGEVLVNPWIQRNTDCCSNVLFIPGFQASRLYLPGNQLWEPNRNADVEKLYMNEEGVSDTNIHVGEIIDKGIGYRVYDSLKNELNTLAKDNKIKEWKPFPYDWRKGQMDIAKEITPTIESLASSSPTGKVNILTHSNGGLIAKSLLESLKKIGKESLIDSIIFIAVPHLGAPKAILSMLYGYDQQIAKGLILNKKTARQLSYNLPGAYGLLPSAYSFPDGGVASSSQDLEKPIALNKSLFDQAKSLHRTIDSLSFPKIFSIAGWNVKTVSTQDKFTKRGDGTVTSSSSAIFDGTQYFDISKYNQDEKKNISHANITEALPVLGLIKDILLNNSDNKSVYEPYIDTNYPLLSSSGEILEIKMFSPVDIHVYDNEGRHTGLALNQKERELEMDMEPGFVTFIDEGIPDSSYSEYMDIKTISVPNTGTYTIKGIGTDAGVFTLQTSILNNEDEEKIVARYEELPVLKDTKIELIVDTSSKDIQDLKIDIEGDGIFEKKIKPNKHKNKINLKKLLPHIKKFFKD